MKKTIECSMAIGLLLVGAAGCGGANELVDEQVGSESEALLAGNVLIGSYSNGKFYLDLDGDGVFTGSDMTVPAATTFGDAESIPLVGYGSGKECGRPTMGHIGVYSPSDGRYFFDMNSNFVFDAGDKQTNYASPFVTAGLQVLPFIWTRKVGATCQGLMGAGVFVGNNGSDIAWMVDLNDNGIYDDDDLGVFGGGDQWPVPIWSAAKNSSVMATFSRNTGTWYVDTNNNKKFDNCVTDSCLSFGGPSDFPFANSGSSVRAVSRFGDKRYIDGNANGLWNGPPSDGAYAWRPNDVWAFIWGRVN